METMLFTTVHTHAGSVFSPIVHESRFIHGVNEYLPRNTLRGRFWHVMSAVGRRGHVAQHRHLLPSRVTVLMNVEC